MQTKQSAQPLTSKELQRRCCIEAGAPPPERMRINVCSFCVPSDAKPSLIRDPLYPNVCNVELELAGSDIERGMPYERIPVTQLSNLAMTQFSSVTELLGERPPFARLKYQPDVSKRDEERKAQKIEKGDDLPTNVFGSDDRIVYQDTSYPWRIVGRIQTANGSCTGCVIGPRLVLTASHCIDWLDGGGAGWVQFSPAYYNGNGPWGLFNSTRVLSWNKAEGSLSDFETAFDYVVLVMDQRVGDMVGYAGYRIYDDDWNGLSVWQHMGYPGDLTSTQRPTYQGDCVISTVQNQSLPGQIGYVLGHFNDTTGGHSGGPVWGWWDNETFPRVVGVQSAAASTPAMSTSGDNEFGGGPGLSALISYARNNYP